MTDELSIIIAVNNEERNIGILYAQLRKILDSVHKKYRIIFVEDGSLDNSYRELCAIYQKDPSVTIIRLKRNFGQIMGLLVGMNFVRSGIIITMDGDLQHNPQDVLKLLEKIDLGFELVNGKKTRRSENLLIKVWPSLIVKRAICLAFGLGSYDINSSFRAYHPRIVHDIKNKGELFRFLPLMAKAKKINFCEVDIDCDQRQFGKSHYHLMGRLKRMAKDIGLLISMANEKNIRKNLNLNHFIAEIKFH